MLPVPHVGQDNGQCLVDVDDDLQVSGKVSLGSANWQWGLQHGLLIEQKTVPIAQLGIVPSIVGIVPSIVGKVPSIVGIVPSIVGKVPSIVGSIVIW